MRSEALQTPDKIEDRHLDAIQHADFVWFFAPDGYVGPTGALEVGFARASGIPVYTDTALKDLTIKNFVEVVEFSPQLCTTHLGNTEFYRRRRRSRAFSTTIDELLCNVAFPAKTLRIVCCSWLKR